MFIRFINYNKQVSLINTDHVNSILIQPAMSGSNVYKVCAYVVGGNERGFTLKTLLTQEQADEVMEKICTAIYKNYAICNLVDDTTGVTQQRK